MKRTLRVTAQDHKQRPAVDVCVCVCATLPIIFFNSSFTADLKKKKKKKKKKNVRFLGLENFFLIKKKVKYLQ